MPLVRNRIGTPRRRSAVRTTMFATKPNKPIRRLTRKPVSRPVRSDIRASYDKSERTVAALRELLLASRTTAIWKAFRPAEFLQLGRQEPVGPVAAANESYRP